MKCPDDRIVSIDSGGGITRIGHPIADKISIGREHVRYPVNHSDGVVGRHADIEIQRLRIIVCDCWSATNQENSVCREDHKCGRRRLESNNRTIERKFVRRRPGGKAITNDGIWTTRSKYRAAYEAPQSSLLINNTNQSCARLRSCLTKGRSNELRRAISSRWRIIDVIDRRIVSAPAARIFS